MIFTKADKERLERIDKNLTRALLDGTRLRKEDDAKYEQRTKQNDATWASLAESQGKLLAALNQIIDSDIQPSLENRVMELQSSVGASLAKLDALIKGSSDGFVVAITDLRTEFNSRLASIYTKLCQEKSARPPSHRAVGGDRISKPESNLKGRKHEIHRKSS